MEIDLGTDDPVDSIMLHVRGAGGDALAAVFRIAGALGCRALDCSTGDLVTSGIHSADRSGDDSGDHTGDHSGWRAFQEFRDRVPGLLDRPDGVPAEPAPRSSCP